MLSKAVHPHPRAVGRRASRQSYGARAAASNDAATIPRMSVTTPPSTTKRASELLARFRARYGAPRPLPRLEPVDELVATVLSQNTSDTNTARSFAGLRSQFPDWNTVIDAPTGDVADAIRSGGLANTKAPRIQRILRAIREQRGDFDLTFLAAMPVDEAAAWLTRLPGVGPKTAACVLLFSLGRAAMPVDTHVHRVALRLALVPSGTNAASTQPALEALIPAAGRYDAHLLFIEHGRQTCHARRPACHACIVADICPSASEFLKGEKP